MEHGIPGASALLSSLNSTKYATVASATVLLWDIALTFDLEISRVWRVRKTLGTTLFFLNRYIPPLLFAYDLYAQFVFSPSIRFCKNYEISSSILDLVSIAIIECVLVMRTHALYQHNILLSLLISLCVISVAVMLTCLLIVVRDETFIPASAIGSRGCLSGCTSPLCQPLLIAFWIPFFLFETLVFVLTLWKSYTSAKVMRLTHSFNIIKVLARDGILYYVVIMSISLCNFLIWILDPFASYVAVGLLKSLQATICSRLLLNLRGILASRAPTMSQFENDFPESLIDLDAFGGPSQSNHSQGSSGNE